jgi:hypothetical protein
MEYIVLNYSSNVDTEHESFIVTFLCALKDLPIKNDPSKVAELTIAHIILDSSRSQS